MKLQELMDLYSDYLLSCLIGVSTLLIAKVLNDNHSQDSILICWLKLS